MSQRELIKTKLELIAALAANQATKPQDWASNIQQTIGRIIEAAQEVSQLVRQFEAGDR